MNVGVVGAGYVGLVAGACFAESGNEVTCVDVDQEKVDRLNQGEIPIYEPGLDRLIESNIEGKRLSFTTDMKSTVESSEVIFIAVGTPQDEDGSADLKYVLQVANSIGKFMNGPKIVVNKSTVPVGTADLVKEAISSQTSFTVDVVSNPEFLKEGAAIDDFMKPDRVVVGADSVEAAEVMRELYSPFVRTDNPILVMDVKSAEVTKYAANALLATKVTFMNEIANFCEKVGADVSAVRRGVGTDGRIGPSFLFPGVGYGGSCFPKDVRALIRKGAEFDFDFKLVQAVDEVNTLQKGRLPQMVSNHFNDVSGLVFAIWGLSFKPQTDDMREAPSLTVIRELASRGAKFRAYDPEAMEMCASILADESIEIEYCQSSYDACTGADALLLITEWNEFRRPNFSKLQSALKQPIIFDGRNQFEPAKMRRLGFTYYSIGRTPVSHEGAE